MNLIHYFGGEPSWCFARVLAKRQPITKADVVEGNEGIGPLAGDSIAAMYGLENSVTAYFGSNRSASRGAVRRADLRFRGHRRSPYRAPAGGLLSARSRLVPRTQRPELDSRQFRRTGASRPLKDGGLHGGNLLACDDLFAAIEQDRQPECNIYEARMTIEMIAAVFESHRPGEPVSIPLENRQKSPESDVTRAVVRGSTGL